MRDETVHAVLTSNSIVPVKLTEVLTNEPILAVVRLAVPVLATVRVTVATEIAVDAGLQTAKVVLCELS